MTRRGERRLIFWLVSGVIIFAIASPALPIAAFYLLTFCSRPDPICDAADSGRLIGMTQEEILKRFGEPGGPDPSDPTVRHYSGSDGFMGICFVRVQFDQSGRACDVQLAWD